MMEVIKRESDLLVVMPGVWKEFVVHATNSC
jgi:hypothetical protein